MQSMVTIVNNVYCIFESSWVSGSGKFSAEEKKIGDYVWWQILAGLAVIIFAIHTNIESGVCLRQI